MTSTTDEQQSSTSSTTDRSLCLVRPHKSGQPVHVNLVESASNPGGLQLVDAHRTTKCSDPQDLVELARQIQNAEDFVRARAHGRLGVIADQMRYLQQQAVKVLNEAKRDDNLHHAACNMVKRPGTIYYLYERQSGQTYLSMISPTEWGIDCPHTFIGAYRLEADNSWTPIEDLDKRQADIDFLDQVLVANKTLLKSIDGPMHPAITCDKTHN